MDSIKSSNKVTLIAVSEFSAGNISIVSPLTLKAPREKSKSLPPSGFAPSATRMSLLVMLGMNLLSYYQTQTGHLRGILPIASVPPSLKCHSRISEKRRRGFRSLQALASRCSLRMVMTSNLFSIMPTVRCTRARRISGYSSRLQAPSLP